jgi:hypothetical protein
MQEPLRGPPSRSSMESTSCPSKASTGAYFLSFRVYCFITIYVMFLIVHLHIGARWNPRCIMFLSTSPCSYCSSDAIELLCLVNRMMVEDEWLEPLTIGSLLMMVVLWLNFF